MPELKQLRVVVGSLGKSGVMIGDTMTIRGDDRVVESANPKQAYVYYTFTDGTKGRLPMDCEVNVQRNTPTVEEEAADRLGQFARSMRRKHDEVFHNLDHQVQTLHDNFKSLRTKGHYRPFDLDKAAGIAKAQEEAGIWAGMVDNMDSHQDLAPDVRWLRQVIVMREYARDALSGRYRNSLSRSTSLTSNLQDDLRLDAFSEFLAFTDHYPYEEMAAIYLPNLEVKVAW
jgi:hypothetical protein